MLPKTRLEVSDAGACSSIRLRLFNGRHRIGRLEVIGEPPMTIESLRYDLEMLKVATNNFSEANKLGKGGFGSAYKGILSNGQQIAVKKLSDGSDQEEPFKKEVMFVSRLEHRNLVKLRGYCVAGLEKFLVYEFVANQSLDLILFDPGKRAHLDWSTRYRIIKGITEGLHYLHVPYETRLIHCALKASNILLDADLNPKISDFRLVRHFGVDQSQANKSCIAGTFGYMAPEYIRQGTLSVKSDIYSLGVLLLEIVSGRSSTNFSQSAGAEHLLAYVWRNWSEGTPLEVVNSVLGDSYSSKEVKKCINLGLMCVQGDPNKRPSMKSIVSYLHFNSDLGTPKKPAFLITGSSSVSEELRFDNSTTKLTGLSSGTDDDTSKF